MVWCLASIARVGRFSRSTRTERFGHFSNPTTARRISAVRQADGSEQSIRREQPMMMESQNSTVPTLPALVERWGQVVEELEHGYSLTFDDYLNDVDLRQLIARALRRVPPAVRDQFGELRDSLQALDARFLTATVQTEHCVWGDS